MIPDVLLEGGLLWTGFLLGILLVKMLLAKVPIARVLLADTIAVVLVASFTILAHVEREAFYLDAAFGVALLAFVGTVAAADRIRRREVR